MGRVECRLLSDEGVVERWEADLERLRTRSSITIGRERFVTKRLSLNATLPVGYHRLALGRANDLTEALVIAAPSRVYRNAVRAWGLFVPIYALHTRESWGVGDLTDLERLQAWSARLGASVVATLPFLAAFVEERVFDPSPYAPASRLFWNELFVDPRRSAEFDRCPDAKALVESAAFQTELGPLTRGRLVDYRGVMRLKRRLIEPLAARLAAAHDARRQTFDDWRRAHPGAEDYAEFRATMERRGEPWPTWPEPLQGGRLGAADYDDRAKHYHLYAQWLTAEQIARVSTRQRAVEAAALKGRATGAQSAATSLDWSMPGLYLDLPLGVHRWSYDVWRYRPMFVTSVSAGAPPDAFFTHGQNWDCPPLHPDAIRRDRYRYPIACLRHQLAHAEVLRIDHVMGLHRLFWVPSGFEASNGVYVRYRADEWYAILSVESHVHRTELVGENLGTVPSYVNRALARHGIRTMYVLQLEARPDRARPLASVRRGASASLNTHDMAPFAAFLRGLDIDSRYEAGLISARQAAKEYRRLERIVRALDASPVLRPHWGPPAPTRPHQPQALSSGGGRGVRRRLERHLLEQCLLWLAASPAGLLLVNLEDLWLETAPQNVPGTGSRPPNWRRRTRHPVERFTASEAVTTLLGRLSQRRQSD